MNSRAPLPRADLEAIISRVDWSSLNGRRILFTGASGFFGSWLLESLLFAIDERKLTASTIVFTRSAASFADRLPHLARHPQLALKEGDIQQPVPALGSIDTLIYSLIPDQVHPLAQTRVFFQQATRHLVTVAQTSGCQHFLLCSTGAVYRSHQTAVPFREHDALIPLNETLSYPRIRREVEDQCHDALKHGPCSLKIARGFAFVGPRLPLDANFAIGNFLRDALKGNPVSVRGNGTAIRSYLYATDMTIGLWKILIQGQNGTAYNLGSAHPVTIRELAETVAGLPAVALPVTVQGQVMAGAAPDNYLPDVSRIKNDLGLAESVPIQEALRRTWHWWRNQN